MLFTYQPNALVENWLNSTIIGILNDGMLRIIAGHKVVVWPGSIPLERRVILKNRRGIRDRLATFWREFAILELHHQEALLTAMHQQTSLPGIFNDNTACTRIDAFPDTIREVIDDLFRFLFETQLNTILVGNKCLRDLHYEAIYYSIPRRVCPFCGLGHLRAPDAPRHALDHYMPISKYPFAGADLRNLPPMCSECNSDFKKDTDILTDDQNHRRHCIDPYNGPSFRVNLAESIPFGGGVFRAIILPRWIIRFIGDSQEYAENWDRVFKIRERYERDILNANFRSWLEHFAIWYSSPRVMAAYNEVTESFPEYIDAVIQEGFADQAFLKVEVFRLIRSECVHPERGEDMKAFLQILITSV
ncbi:hypothetical protein [Yersinia kristensenii]|uniref:hypothetical protein n=1 Tax=Yersinia kristensenii TaxID=28152 RepID=UPI0011A3ECC9|nr:hypothetical protein [Yersinia kristensenii]